MVAHRLEVWVFHGILRRHTFSMIVLEHLAQQIKSLLTCEALVLRIDELVPRFAWERVLRQQVLVVRVEGQSVLVQICVELFGAEDLRDFHQLVIVVAALEEWLTLEDHPSEHAAERPDVERVVIGLHVNKQLGSLEVARSNAHVILLTWVVELGQAPINKAKLAVGVVNHDVMRLHITVHDALGVAVVERLQDLEHVKADVKIVEALIEFAEISIACVDKLRDDGGGLGEGITRDTEHIDDIGASLQRLQDLELSTDLVFLDYNEDG